MGLRELKRERTRQLISDKAFELFTDHGFGRTTVEQIAAAAEVGPSTLYRYFPTKETLVLEFVEDCLFDALGWFREQPADLDLPDGLQSVIERVLRQLERNPDRVRTVYELAGQTPSVSAHLAELIWRWRNELTVELAGRLAGDSVEFTAALAAGTTMNIIEIVVQTWVDNPDGTEVKELALEAMGLLRGGGIPLPTVQA
jgi:AcrR family transcriptional regulator